MTWWIHSVCTAAHGGVLWTTSPCFFKPSSWNVRILISFFTQALSCVLVSQAQNAPNTTHRHLMVTVVQFSTLQLTFFFLPLSGKSSLRINVWRHICTWIMPGIDIYRLLSKYNHQTIEKKIIIDSFFYWSDLLSPINGSLKKSSS